MTWADFVLCMGEGRNTYIIALVDLRLDERIILKRSSGDRA